MRIDILVSQTLGRLAGVHAFFELLDQSLPESEWRENEALRQLAHNGNWEFSDFDAERQILDERFRFWLPRFSAYSVIIFLHAVLETQLVACADRVHQERQASFGPADIRGRGIDAAARYIARVGAYDVPRDPAWSKFVDLRDLRNLIVHRVGTKGDSEKHLKTANRLAKAYSGRVLFPGGDCSWYGEVWISVVLCREFVEVVEAFFNRLFNAMEWKWRDESAD